ncbi:hypothetical protein BX600DRAFT_378551 [Xylariales sp. PMI_506]|nr:hypothetical protein BX600DRAFT_378551 [Xylariales sp. PMI_506]
MARPVELDKPSSSPIQQDSSDDELRLHETESATRRTAVLRDADGSIAYPAYIPPQVHSPQSPISPKSTETVSATTKKDSEARHSDPETVGKTKDSENTYSSERPTIESQIKHLTEVPQQNTRRVSIVPQVHRARTNGSLGGGATWQQHYDVSDESSSSSSDDEEDEELSAGGRSTDGVPAHSTRARSSGLYRRFDISNENYETRGKVSKRDGRLNITVNDTSNTGYLAKALGSAVKRVVPASKKTSEEVVQTERPTPSRFSSSTTAASDKGRRPRLNIVIMVIGSRGDAQPFLKIGKVLKEKYGHRVRIATHPAFRDFVEKDTGLEFFSVGGDPSELMAFMVKNPGMIPKLETVTSGDIGRRRAAMAEMFEGFWRACINATDNEMDTHNLKMMGEKTPFIADVIIANPPSFAHVHCAEALGIPLHLMFTFPYTPTQAFPHPLATIKKSNVDPGYTNFMSYPLVEMMVWQGLGDLVNDFRVKTLHLDPVSTLWAPGSTYRLHVPFTYLWSPSIVPKPEDWGEQIDISGFVFLDLASTFQPPQELVNFLDSGEPPIYIGFGSIVVDDADKFTEMIFDGVKRAGVRALVSKGWGGLGQDNVPENIFMLENTPHDWLFPKVRACVIHGGAGTTAIALKCGKPTMIVPFFGDQHFWGTMVSNSGAGPEVVPYKKLDAKKLAEGIKYCLSSEALEAAQKIAKDIEIEGDGADNAIRSFHRHLALSGENSMRCSLLPDRVAVWRVKSTSLKLSALAADILVEKGYLSWRRLRLLRHKEWNDFEGPGEPITGLAGTLMGTVGEFFAGFGSVPYRLAKTSKKREQRKKKKEVRRRQKLQQRQNMLKQRQSTSGGTGGYPFPKTNIETKDQQPDMDIRRPPITAQNTGASLTTVPTTNTTNTTTPGLNNAAEEYVNEVSEGIGQSGRALARAPLDWSLAVAQGFHNAPRLYGDDTVRRPIRVTGIRSGLRAAGSEFALGIYDAFTGVVRLPVKGAKEAGIRGAVSGVGMGMGGLVLKNIAAIISPFGYTMKGISKQFERGGQPGRYIRRARIVQAQREMKAFSEDEKKAVCLEVYKGWDIMRQLGEASMKEYRKRGLVRRIVRPKLDTNSKKGKELGKYSKGKAFESVETAERAIASIKKGEDIDVALGKNRKSLDTRRSEQQQPLHMPADTEEAAEADDEAKKNAVKAVEEDVQADNLPPKRLDTPPLRANSDS